MSTEHHQFVIVGAGMAADAAAHGIRDQGIAPEFWADSNFGALLTNDWQPKYTAWILANATKIPAALIGPSATAV